MTEAVGPRRRLTSLLIVLAVAAGLLAMHQLSVGHAAVDPSDDAWATTAHHAPVGEHGAASDQHEQPSDQHEQPTGPGCVGCADHGMTMISCLAAIGLLIMTWLLRPRHRPGTRPMITLRSSPPTASMLAGWRRRPMSLLELEISRT